MYLANISLNSRLSSTHKTTVHSRIAILWSLKYFRGLLHPYFWDDIICTYPIRLQAMGDLSRKSHAFFPQACQPNVKRICENSDDKGGGVPAPNGDRERSVRTQQERGRKRLEDEETERDSMWCEFFMARGLLKQVFQSQQMHPISEFELNENMIRAIS
eukprot:jgi/Botrbrau1/4161/Bobra.0192s0029.1